MAAATVMAMPIAKAMARVAGSPHGGLRGGGGLQLPLGSHLSGPSVPLEPSIEVISSCVEFDLLGPRPR